MNIAPEHEADFNAWYNQEHLPALSAVPGVLAARRYHGNAQSSHNYAAIYHLTDPGVTQGDAWKAAASSPWTDRLKPHFGDHVRILSEAYKRSA